MTGHASTRASSIISTSAGSLLSRTSSTSDCYPGEYYALAEQQGAGFEPDVLTLKASGAPEPDDAAEPPVPRPSGQGGGDGSAGGGVLVAEPRVRITAETDLEFYRRKQNVVAVRHVS